MPMIPKTCLQGGPLALLGIALLNLSGSVSGVEIDVGKRSWSGSAFLQIHRK